MKFLKKHKTIISIALGFIFASLFLLQCNRTKELKQEKKNLEQEIKQNKEALKDSSAIIQAKSNEIYLYSTLLQDAHDKIDSLKDVKPETVTVTKIKYKDTSGKKIPNQTLTKNDKFGTKFQFNDDIMGFTGESFFDIKLKNDSFEINSDSTYIYNRKINFAIALYKYTQDNIKKVGAKPYALKENGELGKELKNIDLSTRSVTIKDENNTIDRKKFVPTISAGIGPFYSPFNNSIGFGPSIIIGYGRRLDH